ncbi:MAG: outer membrane protein assembly factor BamA [Gemmatimonadetes bacterium]|nr:outer membrane protein assembly factor BamA [Gemmatimonadota bacterium]
MKDRLWAAALAALVTFGSRAASLWAQEGATSEGVRVESVLVEGNRRQADAVILGDFGVRAGDVTNYRVIQAGIRKLFATGQYSDVEVFTRAGGTEPTVLVVRVEERPFVRDYEFQGLKHLSARSIRDTIKLTANTPLNPSRIFRARRTIVERLAREGYPRATVDTLIRPRGEEGSVAVVFDVREGRQLVVADVALEGNESFGDDELRGALKTKEEGFFWFRQGKFDSEEYRKDMEERLPGFYAARGHIDFDFLGDSIEVDPATGKARVLLNVSEGPRYRIAGIEVEGTKEFPTEVILERYPRRERSLLGRLPLLGGGGAPGEGDVFDAVAWRKATDAVRTLYRNSGYLYAQVEPIVERVEPTDSTAGPAVKLTWRIIENDPAYIHTIWIAGNTKTHERVIRERLVILPGDVYSDERVVQSYQSVMGLGFFDPLPPQEALEVKPTESGDIDVTLRVKERQTGNINFGASASPATGLGGFIGYDDTNLFGQAKQGHFRWLFGSRANDIEVSYSDPSLFGSRKSLSLSLRNSRDRFSSFGLGRRRQSGGVVRYGTPFPGSRWTRIFVGYSLFRDRFDTRAEEIDIRRRQLLNIGTRSSLELTLARDTRNHPLFPTAGTRSSIALEQTGGPIGGDGNYRKLTFESRWYMPVARVQTSPTQVPIEFTFGLSLRGGAIFGQNPFFLERFFMGGVQYGEPLRGYEELAVTPFGHVPRGTPGFSQVDRVGESFFASTLEFGVRLSGNFYVNVFHDAGNVWLGPDSFNPTRLLRGAGVGVSLLTPLGPLGLDYAYGFDRRDRAGRPAPGWKLHFRFGQLF